MKAPAFDDRPFERGRAGFWLSAAVLAGGVGIAAWLLPNRARSTQVEREDSVDAELGSVGELLPAAVEI